MFYSSSSPCFSRMNLSIFGFTPPHSRTTSFNNLSNSASSFTDNRMCLGRIFPILLLLPWLARIPANNQDNQRIEKISLFTCKFNDFSTQIFQNCCQVDWGERSDPRCIRPLPEVSVNPANREVETCSARSWSDAGGDVAKPQRHPCTCNLVL